MLRSRISQGRKTAASAVHEQQLVDMCFRPGCITMAAIGLARKEHLVNMCKRSGDLTLTVTNFVLNEHLVEM